VVGKFIADEAVRTLHRRLEEEVSGKDRVQIACEINRPDLKTKGLCDVLKGGMVYELKFVRELTNEHYLQLACYMYALEEEKGLLWNTRTNEKVEVRIKDREAFIKAVEIAVNKM